MKDPPKQSEIQEIRQLVNELETIEKRLHELTGGQVDTLLSPEGQSYLLGPMQDHLRRSEANLKETSNTLQGIIDALPAHLALLDEDGFILMVNDSWRRFGQANTLVSQDSCIGLNYLEICDAAHGDSAQEAAKGIRTVIQGKADQFDMEYPCHSPNEKRWFKLMATPLERMGHSDASAVVMHIDITERMLAELNLRISEERHRKAQEIAELGWYYWNLDTDWLECSDETYRLFGMDPDHFEHTYESYIKLVHPDDRRWLDEKVKVFLKEKGDPLSMNHRIILPDGKVRWLRAIGRGFSPAGKIED